MNDYFKEAEMITLQRLLKTINEYVIVNDIVIYDKEIIQAIQQIIQERLRNDK